MDEYESLKLDRQLCFPLYAAARRVTGVYTPYFKPLGLTYTQYIVFMEPCRVRMSVNMSSVPATR